MDDASDSNFASASSMNWEDNFDNELLAQEPKLLWYMRDHSQNPSGLSRNENPLELEIPNWCSAAEAPKIPFLQDDLTTVPYTKSSHSSLLESEEALTSAFPGLETCNYDMSNGFTVDGDCIGQLSLKGAHESGLVSYPQTRISIPALLDNQDCLSSLEAFDHIPLHRSEITWDGTLQIDPRLSESHRQTDVIDQGMSAALYENINSRDS
jgi:hypothetical protein